MTYREFLVPALEEWLDIFGVEPESTDGEPTVRTLILKNQTTDSLKITYDIFGRSFYCSWKNNETSLIEIYRESATNLKITNESGKKQISVDFESNELSGKLVITVNPLFNIADNLLFR